MKRINEKKLFGSAIVAALFLSMGMTVFAATSSTSFTYDQKVVNCVLDVDWNIGKDDAYAKTYVSGGSGLYPLGAYILAFDNNGDLVGSDNITAFDSAQTKTLSYTASEFRSTHNIQDSARTPLKSTKLSVSN